MNKYTCDTCQTPGPTRKARKAHSLAVGNRCSGIWTPTAEALADYEARVEAAANAPARTYYVSPLTLFLNRRSPR